MKTKRKVEAPKEAPKAEVPAPIPALIPEEKKKERFQLSFDINEDGSPDLSSLRESTREKVKQFFGNPKIAELFDVKPQQPEVQVFHPAMIGGMYDLVGVLEAWAVEKYWAIPQPICKHVFTYSPEEKRALEGPTVRVLNKYAADWMIKYQDEISLATLLASITIAKINAAKLIAKREAANITEMPRQEKNQDSGKKEGVM
jgi:hypothetical protein